MVNGVLLGVSSSANTGTVELTSAGAYSVASYGSTSTGGGYINFTNSSGGASTLTFTAATNVVTTGSGGGRAIGNLSTDLTLIFNGAVDIGSTFNSGVTFNAVGDITINGAVINNSSGVRSLSKDGAGTLTLAGNNNYNGVTYLNAGTLTLVGDKTTVAVNGNSGSTLKLQSGTLTLSGTAGDFTNTATVIGSGSIIKNGGALMYLNNAGGTFSGGLTLNAGELAFTSSGDYGAGVLTNSVFGTGTLTLNGGILRSSSDISGRNIANRVILGGDVQLGKSGAAATLTFNNTGGGTTTLATNLTLTTVADVSYLQEISGSNYRLTKAGSGILSLDASNNIAGVDVSAGKISYRNRNAFGTGLMTLADGVTLGQSNTINNPNLSGNSRLDRSLVNDLRLDGRSRIAVYSNRGFISN